MIRRRALITGLVMLAFVVLVRGFGAESRPAAGKSAPIILEAYDVQASAFSDFGMSLRTNFEVKVGGAITWMKVGAVEPGSSAARMGLKPGDRILAVDGHLIGKLDRDQMLEHFFQRRKGEQSRVLVLGPKDSLPHFVMLEASRPPVSSPK